MRAVHTIDILNLWNAMLKLRGISYRVLGDERLQVALRYYIHRMIKFRVCVQSGYIRWDDLICPFCLAYVLETYMARERERAFQANCLAIPTTGVTRISVRLWIIDPPRSRQLNNSLRLFNY